jgi:response regulator of citrate/malate metabolism
MASTRIVIVTAIDDLRTIQQSRDLGAADYRTKPINRDQLQQVVGRLASRTQDDERTQANASETVANLPIPEAIEAEYALETPVRCPACAERIATLKAIRLIRGPVNFTSTLPRRGRVLACPHCLAIVPGELTNF